MPTTTNYGWTTPADTDLVKDGAAAIRTLGSSIDTTTKNLNPQTTTGAIAYRSATSNVNTALAIGTAGQVLTVNAGATAPEWKTTAASVSFNTGVGYTATSQGTTSATYTDLATVTSTTVTTGTKALVSIVCRTLNQSSVAGLIASFAISGATTVAADDRYGVGMVFFDSGTNMQIQSGGTFIVTGLTAGSNTFTMKFKRPDGVIAANFSQRSISVVDLGS